MANRWFKLAFLAFQFLWLNVILPGHTRGVVTMPGTGTAGTHTCCAAKSDRGHDPKQQSQQDRAAHCALCFYAVRMTPAVYVDLTPPPLELTRQQHEPVRQLSHGIAAPPTCDERGPPTAHT